MIHTTVLIRWWKPAGSSVATCTLASIPLTHSRGRLEHLECNFHHPTQESIPMAWEWKMLFERYYFEMLAVWWCLVSFLLLDGWHGVIGQSTGQNFCSTPWGGGALTSWCFAVASLVPKVKIWVKIGDFVWFLLVINKDEPCQPFVWLASC